MARWVLHSPFSVTRRVIGAERISVQTYRASCLRCVGLDVGAVGDTATNYYYLLKTVDVRGFKAGDSNMAGEFDKFIIGGL